MMFDSRRIYEVLVLFLIHAVSGCSEDARKKLTVSLQNRCPYEDELATWYQHHHVPCGSNVSPTLMSFHPIVQYSRVNNNKTYTLLLVGQDTPVPKGLSLLPRLERVATGIQGVQLRSGYRVSWRPFYCTLQCSYIELTMKYTLILLEEHSPIPEGTSQHIFDIWSFMVQFGMCDPVTMSEVYVPSYKDEKTYEYPDVLY